MLRDACLTATDGGSICCKTLKIVKTYKSTRNMTLSIESIAFIKRQNVFRLLETTTFGERQEGNGKDWSLKIGR